MYVYLKKSKHIFSSKELNGAHSKLKSKFGKRKKVEVFVSGNKTVAGKIYLRKSFAIMFLPH